MSKSSPDAVELPDDRLPVQPSPPLRVGVIGTGALGRHHTRILSGLPEAELVGIYDLRPETAAAIAEEHGARVYPGVDELAADAEAVVLAVPTVDHAAIGCRLLEDGLHVMVEKPITGTLAEADRLIESAGDRVLAVGHVEFFNPAVQALLALKARPRFVEVQRLSTFTPRSLDIDVILDLMIHDLQILQALDGGPVAELRATGIPVLSPRIDMANVRVAFESGCVANITASRVSSEPVRKLRVFNPDAYYSLDYREQEIKGYGLDEVDGERKIVPKKLDFEKAEPLRCELQAFVAACRGDRSGIVDGGMGREALATALALVRATGAG